MIELTDADRVLIRKMIDADEPQHHFFRAGLAAGIERAAQIAEESALEWDNGKSRRHIIAIHCAAAIRSLLK